MGKGLINIFKRKEFKGDLKLSLFVILSVCFLFVPAFVGLRGIFHDDLGLDAFLKYFFLAESFQNGHIPLWDPHTWCGAIPFFARYYAETFYIPQWPFLLVADLSSLKNAFTVLMLLPLVLHFCAAALGMGVFLKKVLKLGSLASFFGACAYVFLPVMSTAYGWQQVIYLQTWLVWLLSFHYFSVTSPRYWKNGVCAFLFFLVIVAANPGIWQFVLFVWGGFGLFCVFAAGQTKGIVFKRSLFSTLFTIVVGSGMAGVYLFGFAKGCGFTSQHIELSTQAALGEAGGSLHPAFLATLFVPWMFGNISGDFFSFLAPFSRALYWESNLAGGMFFSFLVFVGAVGVFVKNQKQRFDHTRVGLFCLILYLFSLLLVLGRYTPVYEYTVGLIPGVGRLPRPIRYRYLQCFAACVLASCGIELLVGGFFARLKRALLCRVCLLSYSVFAAVVLLVVLFVPLGGGQEYIWMGKPHGVAGKGAVSGTVSGFFPTGTQCGVYVGDGKKQGPFDAVHDSAVMDRIGFFCSGTGVVTVEVGSTGKNAVTVAQVDVDRQGWHEAAVNAKVGDFVSVRTDSPGLLFGKSFVSGDGTRNLVKFAGGDWEDDGAFSALAFRLNATTGYENTLTRLRAQKKGNFGVLFYALLSLLVLLAMGLFAFFPLRAACSVLVLAAFCELLVLAFGSFYFTSFAFGNPALNHKRSVWPEEHDISRVAAGFFNNRAGGSLYRFATDEAFVDNFARVFGQHALLGYDMHPLESRFKQAFENAYGMSVGYEMYYNRPFPLPGKSWFLSNFSVRYFLSRNPEKSIGTNQVRPEKIPGTGFYVHTNKDAPKRFYWQDRFEVADEQKQLEMLCGTDLKHKGVVDFLPEGIPPYDQCLGTDALLRLNSVDMGSVSNPNRVELVCKVTHPAMLVCTDVYFPGWEVLVDGEPAECLRVNYCQRGVWLEKGNHRVVFVFKPAAFLWGSWCSLLFFALWLLWMCFGWKLKWKCLVPVENTSGQA